MVNVGAKMMTDKKTKKCEFFQGKHIPLKGVPLVIISIGEMNTFYPKNIYSEYFIFYPELKGEKDAVEHQKLFLENISLNKVSPEIFSADQFWHSFWESIKRNTESQIETSILKLNTEQKRDLLPYNLSNAQFSDMAVLFLLKKPEKEFNFIRRNTRCSKLKEKIDLLLEAFDEVKVETSEIQYG